MYIYLFKYRFTISICERITRIKTFGHTQNIKKCVNKKYKNL